MALVDRYIAAHKALRPRGVIWEVKPGSVTEREIRIEAEQLAEIHQSVDDLIKEADLRQVFHLLEEWENVFELPHTGTYEERLAALNAADSEGVLPIAKYIELCATLGVTVKIREHSRGNHHGTGRLEYLRLKLDAAALAELDKNRGG